MKIVAYYRVSTAKQGRSGLGLEAQRAAVEAYARQYGVTVAAEFTDVESGKIDARPGLEQARLVALAQGAAIVVASLDRLSRDVAFIATLMKEGVRFTCADMPTASEFELHIRASIAHEERRKISERTRLAMAAAKARGRTFGGYMGGPAPTVDTAAIRAAAAKRNAHIVPMVKALAATGMSAKAIARALEAQGVRTAKGSTAWQATQVARVLTMGA